MIGVWINNSDNNDNDNSVLVIIIMIVYSIKFANLNLINLDLKDDLTWTLMLILTWKIFRY